MDMTMSEQSDIIINDYESEMDSGIMSEGYVLNKFDANKTTSMYSVKGGSVMCDDIKDDSIYKIYENDEEMNTSIENHAN